MKKIPLKVEASELVDPEELFKRVQKKQEAFQERLYCFLILCKYLWN